MAEEVTLQADVDSNPSTTRQRKKRKWDQPAESVISAVASIPGLLPLSGPVALAGISLPGIFPSLVGVYPAIPTATASAQISSTLTTVQQNAVAIVQKINQDLVSKGLMPQTKIQDELIAREIVINDAESSVRYKLTKRQTQEEIQSKTGAVVITRGKYKPPNEPADHEKPLYLHISAGAHLTDTAERIRAVDQAATLVDEMLRQGHQVSGSSSMGQLGNSPLSTVVFVDFEADSPFDLINRIRGPNDQYINHIMNETGATVLLKGGACEGSCSEEIPQPLHLLISADHAKSLDDARSLAEHLLETIRFEFVGSRPPYFPPPVSYNLQQPPLQVANRMEPGSVHPVSLAQQSSLMIPDALVQSAITNLTSQPAVDFNVNRLGSLKNYSAVPPPKQLVTVDAGSGKSMVGSEMVLSAEAKPDSTSEAPSFLSTALASTPLPASSAFAAYAGYPALSMPYTAAPGHQLYSQQSYGIYPQASQGSEPYSGYSAYSGLYPHASPLQQVALALQRPPQSQVSRQPSSLPEESEAYRKPLNSVSQGQVETQERQRRKFQESPALKKERLVDQAALTKQKEQYRFFEAASKQQLMPPHRAMLPPPPGNMPPPPPRNKPTMAPPPPKTVFSSTIGAANVTSSIAPKSMPTPAAPVHVKMPQLEASGIKLVEYGEDDDDDVDDAEDGISADPDGKDAKPYASSKPFWAV